MHPASAAIVAAVHACVGTPFRPQGRLPGVGLDCVGVALVAAAAVELRPVVPRYTLGGDHEERLDAFILGLGGTPVAVAEAGDLVIVAPASHRRHIAVAVPDGIVHAHAGLGRVVEGPLDPAWPVVAVWRFPERS